MRVTLGLATGLGKVTGSAFEVKIRSQAVIGVAALAWARR